MPNQIPVINYVLHTIDDTCYWINISMEHLIILNEMLKEDEINIKREVIIELNEIYGVLDQMLIKMDNIRKTALYDKRNSDFLIHLCSNTLRRLEELSGVEVQFIQVLGKLESVVDNSLHIVIINHITLEERYSLEMLSGHINQITGLGFC